MGDIRHKFITDAELHDPKGFGTASNKTVLTKDENGVSRYVATTVLEKALNFVDGNAAPPTEVLGAVYVLIDEGNGAVDSGWDGASYDDWVRFNGTTWVSYTPSEGVFCYNATDNTLYLFTTSWDQYGVGSNMANANLTLDANRTHDLAGYNLTFSGGTTIHEGADTLSSSSHTKFYDGDTTPNLLWDWRNDGSVFFNQNTLFSFSGNLLTFTGGIVTINQDSGVGTRIDYGIIGGAVASWGSLSHSDHSTSTNYGFAQASDGTTHINSPEKILLKQDGIEYGRFTDTISQLLSQLGVGGTPDASAILDIQSTNKGFLMPRLTTAQMNAIVSPATHLKILNTDEGREYRYNGSAWVSNEYVEYDFALRSNGTTTYYTDFYTCYNDAVSGDIIDVQTDHTTDCGGIAIWSWDKDITINLNGHNLIVTGLGYIGVRANVKIKMTNGTFESVPNTINQAAFNFVGTTGTAYFEGDGAVNVFCYVGGSARGSFRQDSTGEVKISGVIMRGSASYCVQGGSGRMYVDNCVMYTDEATNTNAIYGDNVTVTNSTIYGQVFSASGSYSFSTAGGRSKVRLFKNCNIIPLGTETPIGSRCAIFENCNIEATDNEVRNGIGGEQEYYNCKLERKGTAGTAFQVTNVVGSQCRFYNSEIISTGGGVTSNLPCEFYYTYIKTESGIGINLTTSVFDLNMIIDNCYIDTTGGDCIYTGSINNGLNATITNSTLISRTDNEFCLNAPTGTYFKFAKNIFKNTADSNDVYSRVGLVTENTQIQITDSFGNIILD